MEWPEDQDAEFYGDPCDADVYEGPAEWYLIHEMREMRRRRIILAIVLGVLFFIVVML